MSVTYYEENKVFLLQTNRSTYAMQIHDDGYVCHLHWGGKIEELQDLPTLRELAQRKTLVGKGVPPTEFLEYRSWGGSSVMEPALKITFRDGTRNLFLHYRSHEICGETLKIVTGDPQYPVQVTLFYRVCPEFDILQRWVEVKNTGEESFVIEMAASANWSLPIRQDYRLTYFTGNYAREFQMNREKLGYAKRVLETRRGVSGFDCVPFFMVDNGDATEDFGEVYFGSVMWSGNWKITVERDSNQQSVVTGGINDFDFSYCLEPAQTYTTPEFFAGYLPEGGFGGASRLLHRYVRAEVVHPTERDRVLPIIYNTHNSFWSQVDEALVLKEIEAAHEIGIELFVLEGGWSGWDEIYSPVNDYNSHRLGYGTWEINKKRFPNGLKPISDKLHSYGMKFGLWIEPEAVFVTNRLVQEHPDWIIGYDNRPLEIAGSMTCYSLDMANDEACEYITQLLIKLIGENGIDYIKNDFNRSNPHMGCRGVAPEHKKEGWDKYVRNMWKCYSRMKEAFPDLIFENSASGGKRTDLGMLRIAGRMHRSDNQDPTDALMLYDGMSYLIPPKFHGGACFVSNAYSGWVNSRRSPVRYQGHMGMLSSLSVSMGLNEIPVQQREEIKAIVAFAKKIRGVVQLGDQYRIVSALNNDYGVYQYVNRETTKSVTFVMGKNMHFAQIPDRVRLKGLNPDAKYRVTGYGEYYKKPWCRHEPTQPRYYEEIPERTKDYGVLTGKGLMHVGLPIAVRGDMYCEVIILEEVR